MFVSSARAGRSHEQAMRARRHVTCPSGVRTFIPEEINIKIIIPFCKIRIRYIPVVYSLFRTSTSGLKNFVIVGFSSAHHSPARMIFFFANLHKLHPIT